MASFLDRFRDRELYVTGSANPKRRGMHYADESGRVYRITRVLPQPKRSPTQWRVMGVPVGYMLEMECGTCEGNGVVVAEVGVRPCPASCAERDGYFYGWNAPRSIP